MRFQRVLEIITLVLAPADVISALQEIILPGTHLPHLGRVWQNVD